MSTTSIVIYLIGVPISMILFAAFVDHFDPEDEFAPGALFFMAAFWPLMIVIFLLAFTVKRLLRVGIALRKAIK